ncbi:MAG: serine hydrolase domain-containing protein [Armatimonadota bacterium]
MNRIGNLLVVVGLAAGLVPCSVVAAAPRPAAEPRAETPARVTERVEALLQNVLKTRRIPGVAAAVIQGGRPVFVKGYGYADVEHKVPVSELTVFQLASVTKQFTAAGVMLLVQDGKLGLDDPITRHLPDLPEAWKEVTVRHLLTHTSGITSYTSLPLDFRKDYSRTELLGLVRDLPLQWKAGERWAYNNSGYYLLGMLIEKLSGVSYGEFLEQRIFGKLGLSTTRVNDLRAVIPNRAEGYTLSGRELRRGEYVSPTQPYAAGALVSSIHDMVRWATTVRAREILRKESWAEIFRPYRLNDGKPTTYGFGWSVDQHQGHPRYHHGGGIPGFSTNIAYYPDDDLAVIVLCNLDGGHAGFLTNQIAAEYVTDLVPKPIEDPDPATTARLRKIVEGIAAGTADEAEFAPETRKALFPDRIREGQRHLGELGKLGEFRLVAHQKTDDHRQLTYRALFGDTPMRVSLALDADGKIAGIGFSPE